jgi:hypothetical protein
MELLIGGVVGLILGALPILSLEFWLGVLYPVLTSLAPSAAVAAIVGVTTTYRVMSEARAPLGTLADRPLSLFSYQVEKLLGIRCILTCAMALFVFMPLPTLGVTRVVILPIAAVLLGTLVMRGNILHGLIVVGAGAGLAYTLTHQPNGVMLLSNCWFVCPILIRNLYHR